MPATRRPITRSTAAPPMATPRIRRATMRDHDALRSLEDAAFQPWRRASRKSLRRSLASKRQSVWIVDHPALAGSAGGLLVLWHHARRIRVYDIATHPALRGQGIGQRLMRHAEDLARASGCRDVSLEADSKDAALLAWYGAQGYRSAERLPDFYAAGRHAVRLRKEL